MARRRPMDYLLIWVMGGRGMCITEGERFEAQAGDLLILERGRAHEYASSACDPWDILWVHYKGKLSREFFQALRNEDGPRARLALDLEIRERWLEVVMAQAGGGPGWELRCNTGLYGLLGLIAYRIGRQGPVQIGQSPFHRVQRFIHDNLASSLTLECLAREMNLSVPHFTRLFRQHFSMSPMQYIIQNRMALAASLLVETGMPLKQIAGAVGYEDPFYFSRLFRKCVGVNPSEYRRKEQRG